MFGDLIIPTAGMAGGVMRLTAAKRSIEFNKALASVLMHIILNFTALTPFLLLSLTLFRIDKFNHVGPRSCSP